MSALTRSLILLSLLAACTPSPYRLGVKAAKDGRYVDATASWLTALDADIYASKPRKALRENGKTAWVELMDTAREHEASQRFEKGLATYDEALAFAEELDGVELLSWSTADATAEREDLLKTWSMAERAKGTVAHDAGTWAKAEEHFNAAREIAGRLATPLRNTGLDDEQGASYAAWAREDVERHRYHDAASHFRSAYELTRDLELDAWAASVDVGLGRYALSKGACRKAVEHFERAGDVVGDKQLPADLAQALDCSRLGLLLDPVEERIRYAGGEVALGSMLLDRIEREVGMAGSRYVRILASEVLSTIEDPPEDQARITINVSQASVEDEQKTTNKQVTKGVRVVDCDAETSRYDPDSVCTDDVEVEYLLHRTSQTARLSGSVRTIDLGSGEQSTTPLDVQMTHDSNYATDFKLFEAGTTVPIEIGTEASVGRIELSEAIVALSRQPAPLPGADEMLVDAVKALAKEAAKAILDAVDREDALAPPRSLTLIRPVMSATDMEFRVVMPPEGTPTIESTPLEEPAPESPVAEPVAPPTESMMPPTEPVEPTTPAPAEPAKSPVEAP